MYAIRSYYGRRLPGDPGPGAFSPEARDELQARVAGVARDVGLRLTVIATDGTVIRNNFV